MKRTVVRYKTKPESTDDNRRLVEKVFQELQATLPAGVRYAALQLADGTFIHLVETEDGAKPLPEFDAFRQFLTGIRERCIEAPQPGEATIIGNYRMLADKDG